MAEPTQEVREAMDAIFGEGTASIRPEDWSSAEERAAERERTGQPLTAEEIEAKLRDAEKDLPPLSMPYL